MTTYDDASLLYDDSDVQYGGLVYSSFGISGVQYRVVFRAFADTVTFGKGDVLAEIQNAKNIGWAYYVNDVPEMFFTINQDDPKLAAIRLNGTGNITMEASSTKPAFILVEDIGST